MQQDHSESSDSSSSSISSSSARLHVPYPPPNLQNGKHLLLDQHISKHDVSLVGETFLVPALAGYRRFLLIDCLAN